LENKHLNNATVFKAFCDETRLMVLSLLQSGEKCACELLEQVNVSQSTLSHHMKILVESGIVVARKDGKWTYYSISQEGSKTAIELLKSLTVIAVDTAIIKRDCTTDIASDTKKCC
jgi:ArsR family transcriptional regulator